MTNAAQAYLQALAAEMENRPVARSAYDEKREAEKQRRATEIQKVYEKTLQEMPVELAEYYSFFSGDPICPLKVSIPLHNDFYVGYWEGGLKYKDSLYRYPFSCPLPDVISRAKSMYISHSPKPEPEPKPKPKPRQKPRKKPKPKTTEPLPLPPTAIESAKSACEVGHYEEAIAFALIEIAERLKEKHGI